MKFTVQTKEFAKAVAVASTAIASRNTIPVLNCVHIECTEQGVVVAGTDLDNFVRSTCDASTHDEGGAICVLADDLINYLGKVSAFEITVVAEKTEVTITAGRSSFVILGIPGEDFPLWPKFEEGEPCRVNASILAAGLRACAPMMAPRNSSKDIFKSVNLHLAPEFVQITSTDTQRVTRWAKGEKPEQLQQVLLTRDVVSRLEPRLKGIDEVLIYPPSEKCSLIAIEWPGGMLVSRTLDGDYPADDRIAQQFQKGDGSWTVDREALIAAAELVAVAGEGDAKAIWLDFSGSDPIRVWAYGYNKKAEEFVQAHSNLFGSEEKPRIKLQPGFLLDALNAFSCKDVELSLLAHTFFDPQTRKPYQSYKFTLHGVGESVECIISPLADRS